MLKYPRKNLKNERKVILTGEGYFEIKPNPEKPFSVETTKTIVTVLGTSFNISQDREKKTTRVSVVSGKVSFYKRRNGDKKIILFANEEGVFSEMERTLKKMEITNPNFLAWKTGKIIFEQSGLHEICQTITDVYGTDLYFEQSELGKLEMSAIFDNQSFMEVLTIIEHTLDITHTKHNGKYLLISISRLL